MAAYIPATRGGFIWDDDNHVTENMTLRSTDGLGRIWLEPGATPQYYPLVFTSFWVEYRIWGLEPFGYHTVNILLHALNAVFLWAVLTRLRIPGAWLAALLFAVHPVHTESVAWISERKNVLSGTFYLASLLAYTRFGLGCEEVPHSARRWAFYALSLLLFVCALLTKTVTCSLPAAILLLTWWKRGRLRVQDLAPLGPMFIVGLALGLFTVSMERHYSGALGEYWRFTLVEQCLIAGRAAWFYPAKLIWPVPLMFIYPKWSIDAAAIWAYAYPIAALVTIIGLWLMRHLVGRAPLVAALFFWGTLFPALGFIDVYPMRYTFVADHYQYLASVGPIVLLAAGIARVLGLAAPAHPAAVGRASVSTFSAAARAGLPLLYVCVLFALTWSRTSVYRNREALWEDTLAKNPSAAMAHNNLGEELTRQKRYEEAVLHFRQGLALLDHPDTRTNLGSLLAVLGHVDEAIPHFEAALRMDPDQADIHTNLGRALSLSGRFDEAVQHLREAIRIDPASIPPRLQLGHIHYRSGRFAEAELAYRETIRVNPNSVDAHVSCAMALAAQDRVDLAIAQYREVLKMSPDHAYARTQLDNLLRQRTGP